jgi:transcriptional regulator with XRE-family HTH domain
MSSKKSTPKVYLWQELLGLHYAHGGVSMDWSAVGARVRTQREYMGYTREQFAELLDVTPKFCADIELGVKGMSVQTLCKISQILRLSTDYILFGSVEHAPSNSLLLLLQSCSETEQAYAEQLLKTFLMAMNSRKEPFR